MRIGCAAAGNRGHYAASPDAADSGSDGKQLGTNGSGVKTGTSRSGGALNRIAGGGIETGGRNRPSRSWSDRSMSRGRTTVVVALVAAAMVGSVVALPVLSGGSNPIDVADGMTPRRQPIRQPRVVTGRARGGRRSDTKRVRNRSPSRSPT